MFKVLINVGPAKPKHKLPESERKALLSESAEGETANHCADADAAPGANQSTERDDTPQIAPYREPGFTAPQTISAVSSPFPEPQPFSTLTSQILL